MCVVDPGGVRVDSGGVRGGFRRWNQGVCLVDPVMDPGVPSYFLLVLLCGKLF